VARRILLVDDEAVLRSLVARAFRQRGFEVVEAADGASGLDVARSASPPFNLVITNSRMPHLDGAALIDYLRQHDPTIPIIHISGSHATRYEHPNLPADVPTLFKPFKIFDLVTEAEELMR
jgi:DNA-binding response OmpR family regulator